MKIIEKKKLVLKSVDVAVTEAQNFKKNSPFIIEISSERIILRGPRKRILSEREIVLPTIKPVVKWAGGKRWLARSAKHLLPQGFCGRYYEPFLGSGAIYFSVKPIRATLSDSNGSLIAAYDALRNDPEGVIRLLKRYPYEEEFYYQMRDRSPRTPKSNAARLFYLNRTCWNGLYRVNQMGKFNTPFGRYKNPTICDPERLRQAANMLRRAKLRVGDFEVIASDAEPGDFIYFDPPYITGHHNNGFLKYNASLFSWQDQTRLAKFAVMMSKKGVFILVSNADHESVVTLYEGFNYYKVRRTSLIGGDIESRGMVYEALLSNYQLLGCTSEVI